MNGWRSFAGIALVSALALACGGSSNLPNDGGAGGGAAGGSGAGGGSAGSGGGSGGAAGGNGACTVSVTGGAGGGSAACEVSVAFDPNQNNTTVAFALTGSSSDFAAAFELGTGNVFATGSFTASNTLLDAVSVISGSDVWLMSAHSQSISDQGSATLTITSTGAPCDAANGSVGWINPQGSMQATLSPQTSTGASGSVTVNVTFTGSGFPAVCTSGSGGGTGGGSGGAGGGSGGAGGGSGGGTDAGVDAGPESLATVNLGSPISGSLTGSLGIVMQPSGATLFGIFAGQEIGGQEVNISGFLGLDGFDAGTYSTPDNGGSLLVTYGSGSTEQDWGSNATANYSLNITATGAPETLGDGNIQYNYAHGTLIETLESADGGAALSLSASF